MPCKIQCADLRDAHLPPEARPPMPDFGGAPVRCRSRNRQCLPGRQSKRGRPAVTGSSCLGRTHGIGVAASQNWNDRSTPVCSGSITIAIKTGGEDMTPKEVIKFMKEQKAVAIDLKFNDFLG